MRHDREGISFIIPTCNSAATVAQTVASIWEGNYGQGDEIILVDDSSTDGTLQVVDAIQATDRSIRVLKHRENRGTAAAARNTGIEAAANDLIFCLDSDNVLASGSVTALHDRLRRTGAEAAAFGEIHFFQATPDQITHKWLFSPEVRLADALAGIFWPGPSGNYLFTRGSWLRAGRYHEPYLENRTLDSWTFAIRQLGTGTRFVTLPGTWYYHRYGHESHYVRNQGRGSQSLAALVGLVPLLDLLEEEDIEYVFSKEGRYVWYDHLADHPVRVKGEVAGESGVVHTLRQPTHIRLRQLAALLLEKTAARMRKLSG